MTVVEIPVEKWPGAVREVTLGSSYGGGTRTSTVTVGGETVQPFLGFEGALPHRPALAVEIVDMEPGDMVRAAVGVPLIVYGPGTADQDNEVLVAVAEVRVAAPQLEGDEIRPFLDGARRPLGRVAQV